MINVVLAFMIIACFLLAVAIHEYAHALTATLLGDTTPRSQGRQSLSLRAQLDPLGTLLCVILAFYPGFQIALGWGKPVKTDPWKLRFGPNGGTLIVSLAGMVASLLVGALAALILHFLPAPLLDPKNNAVIFRITQLIAVFAVVNITLAVFNLLPVYPLDGYQILYTLLPSRQALKFARSAQYGPLIIIALIFILPFVGQITHLDGFFLFRLPYFILQGVLDLVSLISGYSFGDVLVMYSF